MSLRLTNSGAILLAMFGALMVGADRASADNLYWAGLTNGSTYSFGAITSAGAKTTIASGLTFGNALAEKLIFAPNGDLYGFDVSYKGGSGAWGRINPATGAFTQVGNLYTYFPYGCDHTEVDGFSLAFDPSGTLYATGWGTDYASDFGTLNLTTGAFTKIAASPLGFGAPGSIATWGDTIYWAGLTNGSTYSFGTITSTGAKTTIASGLTFGNALAEKLIFAPNGDLYGFDVSYKGGSGAWGRINPATGAFTQVGNLYTYFPYGCDHTEVDGFSLAFDPSGTLYATGWGTRASAHPA